jgi:ankyrin repeat protein
VDKIDTQTHNPSDDVAMVCYGAAEGEQVNLTNNRRRTPLALACHRGHGRTVNLLTRHGANMDIHDADGWTPLHGACYLSLMDITQIRIESGANLNMPSQGGWTPLHLACMACMSMELLTGHHHYVALSREILAGADRYTGARQ